MHRSCHLSNFDGGLALAYFLGCGDISVVFGGVFGGVFIVVGRGCWWCCLCCSLEFSRQDHVSGPSALLCMRVAQA